MDFLRMTTKWEILKILLMQTLKLLLMQTLKL